jgi:archaellum component FlaC
MSEEQTQTFGNDNQILRQVLTKLEVMDTRLQFVETKVSERGYDTKPIWERALSGIMEVKNELGVFKLEFTTELGGVKQELGNLKHGLGDVKHELGDVKHQLGHVNHELGDVKRELVLVNKKIDVFNNDMLKLRAEQLETEARLRHLEG